MQNVPEHQLAQTTIPKRIGGAPSFGGVHIFAASLSALLLAAWFVYRPGLNGTFLFDDFVNLNALGSMGPIHDWPSLLRYLTSGSADPTGRPLTLLTFLLDAQDWPADPYAFKRTNVLLHLLNGTLLCWAMLKLGNHAGLEESQNRSAALLGTSIWLLHPLLVSTTLYVVQREAMLPATFSMCGLLCWCAGRSRLNQARYISAWSWMVTGSLLCTLLASLCKGNGLLLPLLIATAEFTVLRRSERTLTADAAVHLKWQRIWLLQVPSTLLILYLVTQLPNYIHTAATVRPWTLWQRVLTEPRALVNYLYLLWSPRSISPGVFNDQMNASANWLTPWTTLPSILTVLTICLYGWHVRKRSPILAFSIMFYFAGQIMESTFLPLELFFEHRNYLPATFMFWPLAIWLTEDKGKFLRHGLAVLILIIVPLLTLSNTRVWRNTRQQALIWGKINPSSARAQAFAASMDMAYGHYTDAISRLRAAAANQPDEVQLTLNLVDAECALGQVSPDTWQRALFSLEHTINGSHALFDWFTDTIQRVKTHACTGLKVQDLQQALQAAEKNPIYGQQSGRRQDYAHIAGLIALANEQPQVALDDFNRAFLERPDRGVALAQAATLGAAGYPAYGLHHLDLAEVHAQSIKYGWSMPRLHNWVLLQQGYWQHETAALRAALTADATKRSTQSHNSQIK